MPMVGAALKAQLQPVIKAKLIEQFGTPADDPETTKFALALADAIGNTVVAYIQSNALGIVTSGLGAGGTVQIT